MCKFSCGTEELICFVLDNNGYVIVGDETDSVGKFIADVRPDIMDFLVRDGVYKGTRFYDYQAICFNEPKKEKGSATKIGLVRILKQLLLKSPTFLHVPLNIKHHNNVLVFK